MDLINGITFLTGLVLAIAYGKNHESNQIDKRMVVYVIKTSIDNVMYENILSFFFTSSTTKYNQAYLN